MARRLVLLGDSIFDNGAYVRPGEPDVAAHLRALLPSADWQVELRAVDGSIDLRLVCTETVHFANPIEPSNEGGARIAESIISAVTRLGSR